jgi:endonuclease YncB( thermonuclease family)
LRHFLFLLPQQVTVKTDGLDKYTRTIGDVILPDGTNLNQELVKTAGAGGIGSMRRGIRDLKS